MNTVRNFYKKDCKKQSPECRCTPIIGDNLNVPECSFATDELITNFDEKMRILSAYGYKLPSSEGLEDNSEEALDFIREYPIYIIKAGKILCHSTNKFAVLDFNKETKNFMYSPKMGWWNSFFVGHSKYKGGWFTYETNYGGPMFGLLLYYRVNHDIPVLFAPNHAPLKGNSEYFSIEDTDNNKFTGSHIVRGVKNWHKKGYTKIIPEYYADEFAKRLVDLGFPGYISCDECEVFITHESMQKNLFDRPFRIIYEHDIYIRCAKCNTKSLAERKCQCGNVFPTQPKREETRTIFHMMLEALCPQSDKCPLTINSGSRNKLDLEIKSLPKDVMHKILPEEQFIKEYDKIGFFE